jgi:hypothetical protein
MYFCQGAKDIKLGTVAMPLPAYHRGLFDCSIQVNDKNVVSSRTAHQEAQQRKTLLLKTESSASASVYACSLLNGQLPPATRFARTVKQASIRTQ